MGRVGVVFLVALLLTTAAMGLAVGVAIAGLRGEASWTHAGIGLAAAPVAAAGFLILGRIALVTKRLSAAGGRSRGGDDHEVR